MKKDPICEKKCEIDLVKELLVTIACLKQENERLKLQQNVTKVDDSLFRQVIDDRVRQYQELLDSLQEIVFEIDRDGKLIYVNNKGYDFFGYSRQDIDKGFNVFQCVLEEDRERCIHGMKKILTGTYQGSSEYRLLSKNGKMVHVMIHSSPKVIQGKIVGCRGVMVDITERKKAEEQLKYLTYHDILTGLYNRNHFEEQMRLLEIDGKTPVGIIICDVDGLKLINDTMGHWQGDILLRALSEVLKRTFFQQEMVARIGGDEFAVLLPNSSLKITEEAYHRIFKQIEQYNEKNREMEISLSAGYVFAQTSGNIPQLFKEADDNMYRQKLNHKQSVRSGIVKTLIKALEARDYITEGHAERLQTIVVALGQLVGLPEQKMDALRLFAQFHDVGKVGISDHILFKPGPLTLEEMTEMKKHPEIGYRIANVAPELTSIADWILKHHEWWNGEGYPFALKGTEIPIECRILAIADAYDSMTNDRPYRKALSPDLAMQEVIRGMGKQFDPKLVQIFLDFLDQPK